MAMCGHVRTGPHCPPSSGSSGPAIASEKATVPVKTIIKARDRPIFARHRPNRYTVFRSCITTVLFLVFGDHCMACYTAISQRTKTWRSPPERSPPLSFGVINAANYSNAQSGASVKNTGTYENRHRRENTSIPCKIMQFRDNIKTLQKNLFRYIFNMNVSTPAQVVF